MAVVRPRTRCERTKSSSRASKSSGARAHATSNGRPARNGAGVNISVPLLAQFDGESRRDDG
eukprot:1638412-Prymnesium_polylepis.1